MTDPTADERKRYTPRLQRQAQAYVTAELGVELGGSDVDRQVAMLVQHALEATGAPRVTFFRPVPHSQRWHTVTVLRDGGFYYGLVAADHLVLPMVAYHERKPLLLGPDRPHAIPAPRVEELGFRSYLGLPLVVQERVLAVLEAVDVSQAELLDRYAGSLQEALSALTSALSDVESATGAAAVPTEGVVETTVLDLVLRPPVNEDATFEVLAEEWALLAHLDGSRPLGDVAGAAGVPLPQACGIVAGLLERGLIRTGREDRRR